MARLPRRSILEDKSYFHVSWKCHNSDFLLQSPRTKRKLYELLGKYKSQFQIKIFGYCFMDNHPHIVGYCETVQNFSRYFQVVNASLARFINRESGRRGQVVMDRPHSPRIESERYLLQVLKYIDENPVRARMVQSPKDYEWSSHRAHAYGVADPLLDPLPEGVGLSKETVSGRSSYLKLFQKPRTPTPQNSETRKEPFKIYHHTFFIGSVTWMRKKYDALKKLQLRSPNPHPNKNAPPPFKLKSLSKKNELFSIESKPTEKSTNPLIQKRNPSL